MQQLLSKNNYFKEATIFLRTNLDINLSNPLENIQIKSLSQDLNSSE